MQSCQQANLQRIAIEPTLEPAFQYSMSQRHLLQNCSRNVCRAQTHAMYSLLDSIESGLACMFAEPAGLGGADLLPDLAQLAGHGSQCGALLDPGRHVHHAVPRAGLRLLPAGPHLVLPRRPPPPPPPAPLPPFTHSPHATPLQFRLLSVLHACVGAGTSNCCNLGFRVLE